METTEVQYVHFRVGEDAGALLMTIAQEHLIYNLNPIKAVKTLTDSLGGCPVELALKILKGDVVLLVDVEEQEFFTATRIPEIHDSMFPKIDVVEWYKKKSHEIRENASSLRTAVNRTMLDIRRKDHVEIWFHYSDVVKYINDGDPKRLLDYIDCSNDVFTLTTVIKVVKEFITLSIKTQSVMEWVRKTYISEFEGENLHVYNSVEHDKGLENLIKVFGDLSQLDMSQIEEEEEDLISYIDASIAIDKVLAKGIEPVNIMDNYTAGWLSPDGTYYALNGEIANMLHNQIAIALYEAGIVPKSDDNEVNPDPWLEQNGWVKIHEDKVYFAGCENDRIGKPIVDITEEQIDAIHHYIQVHYKGMLRLGWRMTYVSSARFQMMKNNLPLMYKTYFNF